MDIYGNWPLGKCLYEAEQIRVPTLLIKGEWDADTLMLEKNRMQLFCSVQAFLDDPAPRP